MYTGTVIHGDKLGKLLGYPTANLDIAADTRIHLSDGIYAARALFREKTYRAALVVRFETQKIEVHLIDYQGEDFYGETLSVEPVQKVSESEDYDSVEELVAKIESDIRAIQKIV